MKKFNWNSLLFVFFVIFVITGLWGGCLRKIKDATLNMLSGVFHGRANAVENFISGINGITTDDLSYHDALMDLDSLNKNLMGTRVVKKDSTSVVKSDDGMLMEPFNRIRDKDLRQVVSRIQELKQVSEDNGAVFLYCAAPRKEYYETAPTNVNNYFKDNFDRFVTELGKARIPTLDYAAVFQENGLTSSDIYFATDHHWKPEMGFLAARTLCEKLNAMDGFVINEEAADLQNYEIKHYPDWFLGSSGKKVGSFYTWRGVDDIDLITPKFRTDMREEQPIKDEVREGSFEETVMVMENITEKDYYGKNPYAAYSGGDYRLQIMTNKLNPEGKKILLVRDSYSCAVAPFLSLQTAELHTCDMRNYSYYVGEKVNLKEYIEEIKPDYVVVLYSGIYRIPVARGRYDFF